eukprot:9751187-Karenia_brevis.AAC.1
MVVMMMTTVTVLFLYVGPGPGPMSTLGFARAGEGALQADASLAAAGVAGSANEQELLEKLH